jgi:NADPH:quinone reductase-like Zn-dependent oxidoreductase
MTGGETKQMFETMFLGSLMSMNSSQTITNFIQKINQRDLLFLKELLEQGKVKPMIDQSYPLADVPDAIRHLESGKTKGKLVINVVPQIVHAYTEAASKATTMSFVS